MKVTFYSTHCPKCKILEMKLKQSNIPYVENNNVDEMLAVGLKSAPALQIDDNAPMGFKEAVDWLKEVK